MKIQYWLPTKPTTLIDRINSFAAATGSLGCAIASANADYNGHYATTYEPNSYKRYWTANYTWAGSHRIAGGTFEEVHKACVTWFKGQGRGAVVRTHASSQMECDILFVLGYVPYSEEIEAAHAMTYETWKNGAWEFDVRTHRNNQRDMMLEALLLKMPDDGMEGWQLLMSALKGKNTAERLNLIQAASDSFEAA